MNKKRSSNYELLRILCMLMIIAFHTFRYISPAGFSPLGMIAYHAVRWYGLFGVNCFLMISAWFMIDHPIHTEKIFLLLLQTAFYCVFFLLCRIISMLHQMYSGGQEATIQRILHWLLKTEFTALTSSFWANRYWFITAYVFLYLLIPFFNHLLHQMTASVCRNFVLGLTFFIFFFSTLPETFANTTIVGDVLWVSYVYLLMGYLKLYATENTFKKHCHITLWGSYLLFVAAKTCLTYFVHDTYLSYLLQHTIADSMRYSFMMLLMALGLFYCFGKISLHCIWINHIASYVFGIYLFHENHVFHICALLVQKTQSVFLHKIPCIAMYMFFLVVVLFAAGVLFEGLRRLCFKNHFEVHSQKKLQPFFERVNTLLQPWEK